MEKDPRFFHITRESATNEQKSLADALINLKAETLAPSSAVHKYLRAEVKIDNVLRTVDPGNPILFSRQEFRFHCDELQVMAHYAIENTAVLRSTPKNGGTFTNHQLLKIYETPEQREQPDFPIDYKSGHFVWKLDYPGFFKAFFTNVPRGDHFLITGGLNQDAVIDVLEQNKLLTLVETGEKISLEDFENNERFRSLADKSDLSTKYAVFAKKGENPRTAQGRRIIHDRWVDMSAAFISENARHVLNFASADVRLLDVKLVYRYKELYEKARDQNVLHEPSIQKMIAREFIMNRRHYNQGMFEESNFPLNKLLAYARRIVRGPGNLDELNEGERLQAEQRKNMGEYILSALMDHQEYLEMYYNSLPYKKS